MQQISFAGLVNCLTAMKRRPIKGEAP